MSADGERRVAGAGGETPSGGEAQADAELLELAIEAAPMAGELLLERVRSRTRAEVSSKSTPTDLVSEADLASERAIKELLAERRPGDGFVGEEGGEEQGTSGLSWVVDPLDGTINFLFGIPQWCVSVAVRDGEGTLAGAVYDPNREELFAATRDGGARLSGRSARFPRFGGDAEGEQATELTGSPREDLATAMVATGLAYDARVRAAQARVLARVVPRGARHPPLRQRRARSGVDGGGALRRLLRAHGQAVGHRGRGTDLRTRGVARAGAVQSTRTSPGGSSPLHPPWRSRCWSWSGAPRRLSPPLRRSSHRCGGWDSNPHALTDRGF